MDSRLNTIIWDQKATSRRTFVTGLINNRHKRLNGADEVVDAKKGRFSGPQDFKTSKDRRTSKDKQVYAEENKNAQDYRKTKKRERT